MVKSYADRSPDEQRYWIEGWNDHIKDRASRYDSLAVAGCPHADYYLAGWKSVDEFADEMMKSLGRKIA